MRQTEARMDSQLDEVRSEPGLRSRNSEIRDEREPQATPDGRPLYGSDDWLTRRKQARGCGIHFA
jgi:hypothetical protein